MSPERSEEIVIAGASVSGLATALALAGPGRRITLLEKDAEELPESPEAAFASWERRGSPQTRHSHAFLARLHNLLRERAPKLLDSLYANGAAPMRFREIAAQILPGAEILPEDDEITLIACRRITFEWCLRAYVAALPGVEIRSGVSVDGLVSETDARTGLPRVVGLRLADGEMLPAALVVDATGRRSRIGPWLEKIGAGKLPQETEPCGIFYSSRFYRLREGASMPVLDGPMGADLGFLKYGIFSGDANVYSVTLAASPEDEPLRAVFKEDAFEALARALPATAPWVDPAVALPISPVHTLAKLDNTRRFPVVDGAPLALGIASVGDALLHSNPIVGRGCTLAFVNAFELADAWTQHAADLCAFALDLDARVEREIVPWYEAVRVQDRDAIEVSAMQRRGEDPFAPNRADGSVDPKAYMRSVMRDGFVPALREDIGVLRAFMRLFNLLSAPADLMGEPALLAKVLAVHQRRTQGAPEDRGPTRDELLQYIAA